MIKLNNSYDLDQVTTEVNYLVNQHGWWENSQISLQSPDGNFHTGIGKIEWSNYKELDFNKLNIPDWWQISKFILNNNLYRTRVMKLNPKQCYSYHYDRTPRTHLAVVTHPDCYFMLEKDVFHIPSDGYAYQIDTTKFHTAFNATLDFERIHIVGCVRQ